MYRQELEQLWRDDDENDEQETVNDCQEAGLTLTRSISTSRNAIFLTCGWHIVQTQEYSHQHIF